VTGIGIGIGIGPFGGGSSVTPLTIAPGKVAGWWRSDLGVTLRAGAFVSAWADQSGNGNDAAQSTEALQPAYSATSGPGGRPGIEFDGAGDLLNIADNDNLDPGVGSFLHVVVGQFVTGSGSFDVWSGKGTAVSADNWRLFRLNDTKLALFWGNDGQTYTKSTATAASLTTDPLLAYQYLHRGN
jgi:hypothetical protein